MTALAIRPLFPPAWLLGGACSKTIRFIDDISVHVLASSGDCYAGAVESASQSTPSIKVGDAIFGFGSAARQIALKPASLTFEQAAQVVIPAITAWQMVCDHAVVRPEHRVLILGAHTPTGAYARQLAAVRGAEVFTTPGPRVDIVLDMLGRAAQRKVVPYIKPCGALFSSVEMLDPVISEERHIRSAFVAPRISRALLSQVHSLFDSGTLTFQPARAPCAPDLA